MTTLVNQRHGYDCGIACYAMALGITYEQARETFPNVGRFLFDYERFTEAQADVMEAFLNDPERCDKTLDEIEKGEPDLINLPHYRQGMTLDEMHTRFFLAGAASALLKTGTMMLNEALTTLHNYGMELPDDELEAIANDTENFALFDTSSLYTYLHENFPPKRAVMVLADVRPEQPEWPFHYSASVDNQSKALPVATHSVFWDGEKLFDPREKEPQEFPPDNTIAAIVL